MANQIKAPINYPIIAGGKIVSGGSVLFGQPNVKPDEDNPSTLKAIYLDAALSQQAENPQGISSDGVFDQSDTGILYGPTDTVYSIVIRGANNKELSYIPEYDLSDANAAQTAQDAAAAAASSEANAIAAKDLTEALYTDFTNRYFGAYSSNPAVDDLGNPPNEGSIYFNTTSDVFYTWNGSAWINYFPSNPNGLMVTATGATTPRALGDIAADTVNIKGFESLVTSGDWKPAFESAALLGRPIFMPNGEYLVSGLTPTHWGLVGESEKGVTIKLMDNINNNVISLINNTSLALKNLTIDQNKTNQTGGHCIRFGGTDGVDIQNVTLKNAFSYGIGVQAGTNKNIRIDNLTTLETGQDGIDIKDYNLDNENIVLSNITCINYGLATTGQTGVDIRGPVVLSNLRCSTTANDTRAFRLRGATVQGRAGSGVINNISYTGAGDAASYAIQISTGVINYSIENVYCENAGLIVVFEAGAAGNVSNIVGSNISGDAISMRGDGAIINGLNVDSCLRGFDIESSSPNNSIINFDIRGVTSGEFGRVQSGSTGFKLLNGKVEVGKTLNTSEAAVVRDVTNYKTRATVISSDILVDSIGTKGFLIPHGLDVTPSLESVQLTLVRSTNNPVDEEIGYLQVETVDSTNISGRLFVTLASGIAGASVKVSARVVMFDD